RRRASCEGAVLLDQGDAEHATAQRGDAAGGAGPQGRAATSAASKASSKQPLNESTELPATPAMVRAGEADSALEQGWFLRAPRDHGDTPLGNMIARTSVLRRLDAPSNLEPPELVTAEALALHPPRNDRDQPCRLDAPAWLAGPFADARK